MLLDGPAAAYFCAGLRVFMSELRKPRPADSAYLTAPNEWLKPTIFML